MPQASIPVASIVSGKMAKSEQQSAGASLPQQTPEHIALSLQQMSAQSSRNIKSSQPQSQAHLSSAQIDNLSSQKYVQKAMSQDQTLSADMKFAKRTFLGLGL